MGAARRLQIVVSRVELADELFVDEEGNVVDAFVGRQYSRRAKKGAAPAATSIK
jgi:hypothetical protein